MAPAASKPVRSEDVVVDLLAFASLSEDEFCELFLRCSRERESESIPVKISNIHTFVTL